MTSKSRVLSTSSLLVITFLVVIYFQACTSSSGGVSFESLGGQASGSVGRGDSYDGKPEDGSYYRVIPETKCGSELALFGQIDVQGQSVKAQFLDTSDCSKREEQLNLSQLEYNSYLKGVLGFGEGVFERKAKAPILDQRDVVLPEVWCRSLNSGETTGIDVIVHGSPATGEVWPSVVVSGSNGASQVSPANPLRRVKGQTLQYGGDGFDLKIDLASQAQTGAKITGRLQVSMNGLNFDQPVACRTAGVLDSKSPVAPLTCPAGFVPVPSLAGYTSSDFCVAKYESKQAGGRAVSQAAGAPWVNINRASALAACQVNGVQYDLISNDEWQSIARNGEAVASNWSGGSVGGGALGSGHSDNEPNSSLAASTDDNQSCFDTLQTCDLNTWSSQRRTLQLENGSVIWDLAGNVIEWVKDDILFSYGPKGPMAQVTNFAPYSNQAKDKFGPSGDYSSLTLQPYGGLGLFETGTSGALVRGGVWYWGSDSGIFEATLTVAADSLQDQLGFRCVYHP